jgi:hypothetical protein
LETEVHESNSSIKVGNNLLHQEEPTLLTDDSFHTLSPFKDIISPFLQIGICGVKYTILFHVPLKGNLMASHHLGHYMNLNTLNVRHWFEPGFPGKSHLAWDQFDTWQYKPRVQRATVSRYGRSRKIVFPRDNEDDESRTQLSSTDYSNTLLIMHILLSLQVTV